MKRRCLILKIGVAWMLATGLAACGGSDTPTATTLNLNLSNAPNLGSGFAYEGWLIVNGAPKSTGQFTVDDGGNLSRNNFTIDNGDGINATKFVLTIEKIGVTGPSKTHFLAGDMTGNSARNASISIADPAALGTNFSTATGQFILAAPTSAQASPQNGIWWLVMNNGTPAPGLSLPTLPAGWKYEGWVVVNGTIISTGKFLMPSGADSDGAGPNAGSGSAPPFPGQDFVNPPLDLRGATAVISVEPDPDNSSAPFALKPLKATISNLTGPTNPQTMTNTVGDGSQLPRGSVSISSSSGGSGY